MKVNYKETVYEKATSVDLPLKIQKIFIIA